MHGHSSLSYYSVSSIKNGDQKTPCWTESSSARWDNYSFYGLIKNTICVLWYHEYSYCLTLMSDFMPSLCKLLKLRLRVIWIWIGLTFAIHLKYYKRRLAQQIPLKKIAPMIALLCYMLRYILLNFKAVHLLLVLFFS